MYRHTQTALQSVVLTIGLVLILLTLLVPAIEDEDVLAPFAIVFVLISAVSLVFSRLTVTVGDESIAAVFGIGWPRREISFDDVESFQMVRNAWWVGWGMRKIRDGWMFNVWGLDAVELTLRSGRKFRIGTDEVQDLYGALTIAIPHAAPRP